MESLVNSWSGSGAFEIPCVKVYCHLGNRLAVAFPKDLFSVICSTEDCLILQRDINVLLEW